MRILRQKIDIKERIRRYTEAPFHFDKGYRRDLIVNDLQYNMELCPMVDVVGNVWCRKGEGKPTTILSSHMDTVFGPNPFRYNVNTKEVQGKTEITGNLDNSMGCVINAEVIDRVDPKRETFFIFSIGEEPRNHQFAYGAQNVCGSIKSMKIKPNLCVALDVTYPVEFVREQSKMKRMKNIIQGATKHELREAVPDQTCAYAENFSNKNLTKLFESFILENGLYPSVKARDLETPDEAYVYGLEYPSLAFGPVVYGNMHGISTTYVENLESSIQFLEKVLTNPEFVNKVSEEDRKNRQK